MIWLWWTGGVVAAMFLFVVLRGAPYVPTHRAQAQRALDMLDMPAGGRVVDLGSGDGVFLKAAAERGYKAIGYEINPVLCLVSFIRCWRYRRQVTVRWRDFWLSPLPKDTDGLFVFLAGPYVRRLHRRLTAESRGLKRPLPVVSYGFLIEEKGAPLRSERALHLYRY